MTHKHTCIVSIDCGLVQLAITIHFIKNNTIVHSFAAVGNMGGSENTGDSVSRKTIGILNDIFGTKVSDVNMVIIEEQLNVQILEHNKRKIPLKQRLINDLLKVQAATINTWFISQGVKTLIMKPNEKFKCSYVTKSFNKVQLSSYEKRKNVGRAFLRDHQFKFSNDIDPSYYDDIGDTMLMLQRFLDQARGY